MYSNWDVWGTIVHHSRKNYCILFCSVKHNAHTMSQRATIVGDVVVRVYKCEGRMENPRKKNGSRKTRAAQRQMVGHWGMKEKEAFGTDVSHLPFQAERDDQNCFICWKSNCSVYCLINEVLWSCTCFHYHHWRHYCDQEWKCEARSSVWLVLTHFQLYLSQNAMFSGGEWAVAYCAPQCHWASRPLLQHNRAFLRRSGSVCGEVFVCPECVCQTENKRICESEATVWETVWDFQRNLLCVKRSEWTVFVLLEWKLKYPTKSSAEPWPIGALSLYLLQMSLHPS